MLGHLLHRRVYMHISGINAGLFVLVLLELLLIFWIELWLGELHGSHEQRARTLMLIPFAGLIAISVRHQRAQHLVLKIGPGGDRATYNDVSDLLAADGVGPFIKPFGAEILEGIASDHLASAIRPCDIRFRPALTAIDH